MEDDRLALSAATQLLTVPERLRVLRGTAFGQPHMVAGHDFLEGLDAFERRDVARRIRSEMGEELAARFANPSIPSVHAVGITLGEYDFDRQGFPLTSYMGNTVVAGVRPQGLPLRVLYRLDPSFVPPMFLDMPEEDARGLMREFTDPPTLALFTELPPLSGFEGDLPDRDSGSEIELTLDVPVMRAVLYADRELTVPLHEFEADAFLRPVERAGGLEPHEVLGLPLAPTEQAIGAVLAEGGPLADELLEIVATRTPSYSLMREDRRGEYAEQIRSRYIDLVPTDGIWVAATTQLVDVDMQAGTYDLRVAPDFSRMGTSGDVEDAGMAVSDFIEPEDHRVVDDGLVLDEALLAHQGSGFSNHVNDGYETTLDMMDGRVITGAGIPSGNRGYRAFARIAMTVRSVDGQPSSSGTVYLNVKPEIFEYYLLLGDPNVPGDLRILVHRDLEASGGQEREDGDGPRITEESVLVIRKAGFDGDAPSVLVISCLDGSDVPEPFASMRPIEMPVAPIEAVTVFLEHMQDTGVWVTRAGCLKEGLASRVAVDGGLGDLIIRNTSANVLADFP